MSHESSQRNLARLREGIAAWNRDGVSGVLPLFRDDMVAYPFPEWPADPVYYGHAGFEKLAGEWTEHFDAYSWEEERAFEVGEDTVVGLVYHHARIKGTDVPIKQPMGTVWKLDGDGNGTEVHFFLTWEEALEAVDLAE